MQANRTGGFGRSVGATRLPESSARTGNDSSQGRVRASAAAAAEETPPADRSIARALERSVISALPSRPLRLGAASYSERRFRNCSLVTIRTTRSEKRPPAARSPVIRSISGRSEASSGRPSAYPSSLAPIVRWNCACSRRR